MNRALVPRRGLTFSLLTHVLVVYAILVLPVYFGASSIARAKNLEAEDFNSADQAIYLPRLGGGSEGSGHPGGGRNLAQKGTPTTSAPSSRGLSNPGTQAILSDPPRPTNTFQTILRPGEKNPAILKTLVRTPNAVKTADAGPSADAQKTQRPKSQSSELKLQAPKTRATKASQPDPVIVAENPTPIPAPALTVPQDDPQRPALPDMQAPKAPTAKTDESSAPQFSPVPTSGQNDQNLLAISMVPAPPGSPTDIPDGEARGRFAISTDANPASSDAQPGSRLEGSASSSPALGKDQNATPGNSVGEGHVSTTEGSAQFGNGGNGGSGQGARSGNGVGDGYGGNGGGNGRGSATGEGMGSGPGRNPGSGSGGGSGPGSGNFRGMSIGSGGAFEGAIARGTVYPVPVAVISKLRRNTVIVSAGPVGGGGLDVYGALDCGKVYSIFLPMPGGNWTMQYCRKTSAAEQAQANVQSSVIHLEAPLAPPDVNSDSMYDFKRTNIPPEKAHKMIVLKGTLREDGTVENIRVYQGVVAEMDDAAALAFSRWKFRPAMQQNKPVSVEILVGIPAETASAVSPQPAH